MIGATPELGQISRSRTDWGGRAAQVLGLTVEGIEADRLDALAALALRRNPRRAHLIVSRVLAKHIPVAGSLARMAGLQLGAAVADVLGGGAAGEARWDLMADAAAAAGAYPTLAGGIQAPDGVVVLGFCETATGLGHLVSDALRVGYVHTTRDLRHRPEVWFGFAEPHSHAPSHQLLDAAKALVSEAGTVVLVDDELSTGTTAMNLIAELAQHAPGQRYIVAALLDLRTDDDRSRLQVQAASAGLDLRFATLARANVTVPPTGAEAAIHQVDRVAPPTPLTTPAAARPATSLAVGVGGDPRLGLPASTFDARERMLEAAAEALSEVIGGARPERTLVVGAEETMHPAIRLADRLGARVQSTSRSPVVAARWDDAYPVRSAVTFRSAYDPSIPGFLYNGADLAPGGEVFDQVVVVTDVGTAADEGHSAPGGLLHVLDQVSRQPLVVVACR